MRRQLQRAQLLEVIEIDVGAWRLSDSRHSPSDAACVVAYVEKVGPWFEVVWMSGPRRRSRFDSLPECLEVAEQVLADDVPTGASRPIPIPHLPPLRA